MYVVPRGGRCLTTNLRLVGDLELTWFKKYDPLLSFPFNDSRGLYCNSGVFSAGGVVGGWTHVFRNSNLIKRNNIIVVGK